MPTTSQDKIVGGYFSGGITWSNVDGPEEDWRCPWRRFIVLKKVYYGREKVEDGLDKVKDGLEMV